MRLGTGYHLGEWTVRPHRNSIERGDEVIHLTPKTMAVLECLAEASNSVVTRQEIFDCVWPDATISDEALTQRISDLRKAFGDSAQHSKIIETIPKIGFRLIPPVIPFKEDSRASRGGQRFISPEQALKWLVPVLLGLLIALALLRYFLPSDPAVPTSLVNAENPSIAVLPFVNMSEDPSNEYFSDGISEELINLLANVPGLDVISRSSSFSFKGKSLKTADMARELNASLIVEGTVRKVDNRVRVTAQLIDPATDKHLLSNSYDRELSDIFTLQEEIAQSIVTALQDKIGAHTVTGSRPTENIEAYELFLQGRQKFHHRRTMLDSAIVLLEMAVKEDPNFATAWAYLAAAASVTWGYQTSIENEEAHRIAEHASKRALELNPESGLALAVQGMLVWHYEGDLNRAFPLVDRAVSADPQDSTIRLWAGMFYFGWGYLEEALSHFHYSYKHDPRVGMTNGMLGQAYLAMEREDLAAPRLAKATELGWPFHFQTQASQQMMKGNFDAAMAILKVSLTDLGADPDPRPWIYELEDAARHYIENPESRNTLIEVVERAPANIPHAKLVLTLLFDLKDEFFEFFSSSVKDTHFWPTFLMPIIWLPEYKDYVEDPRFLEIIGEDGALELWHQRGYPDGCIPVSHPAGDRMDCTQRYL